MGPPIPRGPQTPGLSGSGQVKAKQRARFLKWPATDPLKETKTLCAQVFFETNDDKPQTDDIRVIEDVRAIVQYLADLHDLAECRCVGYADVRDEALHNLLLSQRRARAVAAELSKTLKPTHAALVKDHWRGKALARLAPEFWADDRRVDLVVTCHPARLVAPTLGFESASKHEAEAVVGHDLALLETSRGGTVTRWTREEMIEDYKGRAAASWSKEVLRRLSSMSPTEYYKYRKEHVTAYVVVRYEFVTPRNAHRVYAQVFDAVTDSPLFGEEYIEAETLLDQTGTRYLSSPADGPVQVWRYVKDGQAPPSGRRTRTDTGPAGLVGLNSRKPDELYKKLCGQSSSNIVSRVMKKLKAP